MREKVTALTPLDNNKLKLSKIKTTAAPKAAAPAANRQVKGKYDKLAKAADNILKGLKDK